MVVAFLNSTLAILIIAGARKKKILAVRMHIVVTVLTMIIPVYLLTAWFVKTYNCFVGDVLAVRFVAMNYLLLRKTVFTEFFSFPIPGHSLQTSKQSSSITPLCPTPRVEVSMLALWCQPFNNSFWYILRQLRFYQYTKSII